MGPASPNRSIFPLDLWPPREYIRCFFPAFMICLEESGAHCSPVVLAGKTMSSNPHLLCQPLLNMAKKTFEAALARLEQLTEELADGEQSLENSLKKFDEGIKLASYCNEQLSEARAKVELLLEKDGKLEAVPFDGPESGPQDLSD